MRPGLSSGAATVADHLLFFTSNSEQHSLLSPTHSSATDAHLTMRRIRTLLGEWGVYTLVLRVLAVPYNTQESTPR